MNGAPAVTHISRTIIPTKSSWLAWVLGMSADSSFLQLWREQVALSELLNRTLKLHSAILKPRSKTVTIIYPEFLDGLDALEQSEDVVHVSNVGDVVKLAKQIQPTHLEVDDVEIDYA
ncbi:hypothetical protein HDU77_006782 [Chytriomyces hyalinus]|nr:hypothetical protein HDU77_006782 [Chytriomyces hyalinus]